MLLQVGQGPSILSSKNPVRELAQRGGTSAKTIQVTVFFCVNFMLFNQPLACLMFLSIASPFNLSATLDLIKTKSACVCLSASWQ